MFVYIALIGAFGTALQSTLVTKYARLWDPFSISVYRSLAMLVICFPLLFFVDIEHISEVYAALPSLMLGWVLIAFAFWLFLESTKSLPVGISISLRQSLNAFLVTILSWLILEEKLSPMIIWLLCSLLIGGIIISLVRVDLVHLQKEHFKKSILLAILSGVLTGFGMLFLVKWARVSDPYLSWYLWEFFILISFLLIAGFRKIFLKMSLRKITKKEFWILFLAASPSLLWTGGFTVAATMWPSWITSAIMTSSIAIMTVLGLVLFKEHLRWTQYLGITIIIASIAGIKMFS